ncbi:MAG: hypothetical protein BYD32DRAFT_461012 [Podila humilis]|nr:MAG: hypothetical protein BYD32DRAFT_461012 [Podila humilis]
MATETLLYASLVLAPVTRLYVAYNPPIFLQQHIDLHATYSKHITYSPAHSFTPDVDGHDRSNNYTSPSLVPPPSRLTCILDVSEIHYHGSLAEFDQDDELNTAIHQIQVLTSSSCRNSNPSSITTTSFCVDCVDCNLQACTLCSLLAQHKLLAPTLTVIWEDGQ